MKSRIGIYVDCRPEPFIQCVRSGEHGADIRSVEAVGETCKLMSPEIAIRGGETHPNYRKSWCCA